jgi:hypothetical protein
MFGAREKKAKKGAITSLSIGILVLVSGCLGVSETPGMEQTPADESEVENKILGEVTWSRDSTFNEYVGACTPLDCPLVVGGWQSQRNGLWYNIMPDESVDAATVRMEWDAVSPLMDELYLLLGWCTDGKCETEWVLGESPLEVSAQGMNATDEVLILVHDKPIGDKWIHVRLVHPQEFRLEATMTTFRA